MLSLPLCLYVLLYFQGVLTAVGIVGVGAYSAISDMNIQQQIEDYEKRINKLETDTFAGQTSFNARCSVECNIEPIRNLYNTLNTKVTAIEPVVAEFSAIDETDLGPLTAAVNALNTEITTLEGRVTAEAVVG